MLGDEYGNDYRDDGRRLDTDPDFTMGPKLTLGDDQPSGGRKLGDEQPVGAWDYRTLPNKTLELVRNTGDMHQQGTGYYADSETEMLTVLAYLNYGEKTGTTESMREQIDEAVKKVDELRLVEREEVDKDSFINIQF